MALLQAVDGGDLKYTHDRKLFMERSNQSTICRCFSVKAVRFVLVPEFFTFP